MKGVKHIIFDLGGVLLNIDYHATSRAFQKLGISNFDELYNQAKQTELFDLFETGQVSEAAFYDAMREITNIPLTDHDIRDSWNAMLLDIPLRRLQILQQLQLHYDIVMLSNTNVIHETAFNQMLKEVCGFHSFGVFFDRLYLSHRIGMRKPDAATFSFVLEDCGWAAEDTLFIDDSPQHIASAASLGIKTIHLEKGMTMEDDIFKSKT